MSEIYSMTTGSHRGLQCVLHHQLPGTTGQGAITSSLVVGLLDYVGLLLWFFVAFWMPCINPFQGVKTLKIASYGTSTLRGIQFMEPTIAQPWNTQRWYLSWGDQWQLRHCGGRSPGLDEPEFHHSLAEMDHITLMDSSSVVKSSLFSLF